MKPEDLEYFSGFMGLFFDLFQNINMQDYSTCKAYLPQQKFSTAPRLAVVLSWSNRGEISQISKPLTWRVLRLCLRSGSTTSGSSPRDWVALTPGAKAEENTSVQMVI